MATLFSVSNLLVLPFWFLMIALPLWGVTRRVMQSPWVAAAPAVVYAALVLPRIGEVLGAVGNPSLTGVATLLGSDFGAMAAWVHFLAFDIFVGRWAYLDSRERGINPFLMAPVLFVTFMLGPAGFLAYLIMRTVAGLRPATRLATTMSSPLA